MICKAKSGYQLQTLKTVHEGYDSQRILWGMGLFSQGPSWGLVGSSACSLQVHLDTEPSLVCLGSRRCYSPPAWENKWWHLLSSLGFNIFPQCQRPWWLSRQCDEQIPTQKALIMLVLLTWVISHNLDPEKSCHLRRIDGFGGSTAVTTSWSPSFVDKNKETKPVKMAPSSWL